MYTQNDFDSGNFPSDPTRSEGDTSGCPLVNGERERVHVVATTEGWMDDIPGEDLSVERCGWMCTHPQGDLSVFGTCNGFTHFSAGNKGLRCELWFFSRKDGEEDSGDDYGNVVFTKGGSLAKHRGFASPRR